ncbi:MAG: beta-ketoacyl-[acyl-carrier-protein] synthase family protein [Alphaproteobacteria bacterium]|nr:beta-ketoacyl-[acyl-carrier-protein] synthase family protein [Alphaproteobacteria bacterium]
MSRRVVITGSGALSASGIGTKKLKQALREGRSGIVPLEDEKFSSLRMKYAGLLGDYVAEDHFTKQEISRLYDPVTQYALLAASEAVEQAGLDGLNTENTATIIGATVGGLETVHELSQPGARVHPMTIPMVMGSAPGCQVAMKYGFKGPSFGVASACATTAHAIIQSALMIRSGFADSAIAGGTERICHPYLMKSWDAMRVVSPTKCAPFSATRNGMQLADGAAVFVLEELEAAKARGATILGEILGFGMCSDAGDLVAPDVNGMTKAMTNCLHDAGLSPEDIDYINAHGTGTKLNDKLETSAIHQTFGDYSKSVLVSSTKPIHGHALSATAGLELVACLMALNEGIIAPTINYEEADPECDLNLVTHEARETIVKVAMNNSFAFGGLNTSFAIAAYEG